MRIALVDGARHSKLYPLPLLKLATLCKLRGDLPTLFYGALPPPGQYDEIWISTRFTFEIPFAVALCKEATKRAGRVWVGGIASSLLPHYFEIPGVDVHIGLLPEAEELSPDYSALGFEPEYSITHTTRGCVRRCKFCMVSKLEPRFTERDWLPDIHPNTKRILFYDNNWLAKDIRRDAALLREMKRSGMVASVDFNQALDARLMTEDIADILQGVPIDPVRFAFDGMQEDGHYQRAVRMLAARGFRQFYTYALYNFTDTPQDFYYRLRETVLLHETLNCTVISFPMRFQPILDVDSGRDYVGKHWTAAKKAGFMALLNKHSISGQVSCTTLDEFEYWFGNTADEFDKMLAYPKIHQLADAKRGALRIRRA